MHSRIHNETVFTISNFSLLRFVFLFSFLASNFLVVCFNFVNANCQWVHFCSSSLASWHLIFVFISCDRRAEVSSIHCAFAFEISMYKQVKYKNYSGRPPTGPHTIALPRRSQSRTISCFAAKFSTCLLSNAFIPR